MMEVAPKVTALSPINTVSRESARASDINHAEEERPWRKSISE